MDAVKVDTALIRALRKIATNSRVDRILIEDGRAVVTDGHCLAAIQVSEEHRGVLQIDPIQAQALGRMKGNVVLSKEDGALKTVNGPSTTFLGVVDGSAYVDYKAITKSSFTGPKATSFSLAILEKSLAALKAAGFKNVWIGEQDGPNPLYIKGVPTDDGLEGMVAIMPRMKTT